jgi:hypothetical protein
MARRCALAVTVVAAWLVTAGAEPVELPNGTTLRQVNFERHVASLFGPLGCNAGACHGSFQGKGGFRLSLFGHAPELDFTALTREGLGRRVNVAEPDASLLLLKPTGQVPHEGGQRFTRGSWPYQVLREWIAQGARWSPADSSVQHIEVAPRARRFDKPGQSVRLKVTAQFGDGTRADVTPFCTFRVKDDYVAEVLASGQVRGLKPGDTAVIVTYRGQLLTARLFVPAVREQGTVYPALSEKNSVDHEVSAKLRLLNIVPSQRSGDAEFLRRVTIDVIGTLPAPDELRAFLAETDPGKRAKAIDALLSHPRHAMLWATKLCDITGNNLDTMEDPSELAPKRAKMWHDWFRRRIAANVPYDEIVRGILTATTRESLDLTAWIEREIALYHAAGKGFETAYARRPTLDLFWRRLSGDEFFPLEQMAELTATAFLGVRLGCAQCHKHPYDRWTQADYRAYANIFAQTRFGHSPEAAAAIAERLEARRRLPQGSTGAPIPRMLEVYVAHEPLRRLQRPGTREPFNPKALGGPELDYAGDARAKLCNWLVRRDNPFFARAFVNRVWAHYFGVGLVEPVDAFSLANPPSNDKLLDALARAFAESGYDIRRLERAILTSNTYQLSAVPNPTNAQDQSNFARAYLRRPMAEVVVDMLDSALGVVGDFGTGVPRGARAIEIAPSRVQHEHLANMFRIFGRPLRTASCDCERSAEPAVTQTLFLMSDPALLEKMRTGRLRHLLARQPSDKEIVLELFLATLSRPPDEREEQAALKRVKRAPDRQAGFVDVMWALVNTREFILNH